MNLLLDLIRRFEGLRLQAYRCPAGVWTIGYGSTGPDIVPGLVWTLEQAEQRLQAQAQAFVSGTIALCPRLPQLEPLKMAAIADFAYNLGLSRLAGSTLRKRVNANDWSGAADELRKWVFAGGLKLPGLVIRREIEARMVCAEGFEPSTPRFQAENSTRLS